MKDVSVLKIMSALLVCSFSISLMLCFLSSLRVILFAKQLYECIGRSCVVRRLVDRVGKGRGVVATSRGFWS
jgi:hypothetical protein